MNFKQAFQSLWDQAVVLTCVLQARVEVIHSVEALSCLNPLAKDCGLGVPLLTSTRRCRIIPSGKKGSMCMQCLFLLWWRGLPHISQVSARFVVGVGCFSCCFLLFRQLIIVEDLKLLKQNFFSFPRTSYIMISFPVCFQDHFQIFNFKTCNLPLPRLICALPYAPFSTVPPLTEVLQVNIRNRAFWVLVQALGNAFPRITHMAASL